MSINTLTATAFADASFYGSVGVPGCATAFGGGIGGGCVSYTYNSNANQGLKAREGGRKTAQKSRECKYVANKSHNTLLRCLRQ